MWEIMKVKYGEHRGLLEEGYEPFAVTTENTSYECKDSRTFKTHTQYRSADWIYLKRELGNKA